MNSSLPPLLLRRVPSSLAACFSRTTLPSRRPLARPFHRASRAESRRNNQFKALVGAKRTNEERGGKRGGGPPSSSSDPSSSSSAADAGRFQRGEFLPYKRLMQGILSGWEYRSRKKSLSSEGQGIWTDEAFAAFERWLLSRDEVVVDAAGGAGRRRRGGSPRAAAGSRDDGDDAGSDDAEGDYDDPQRTSADFVSELAARNDALRARIFSESSDDDDDDDDDDHDDAPTVTSPRSRSLARLTRFVLAEAVERVVSAEVPPARRADVLSAAWYKLVCEGGAALEDARSRQLLEVLIVAEGAGGEGAAGGGGGAAGGGRGGAASESWERWDLADDVAAYRDLLLGSTREEEEGEGGAGEEGRTGSAALRSRRHPALARRCCEDGDADAALALVREARALGLGTLGCDHFASILAMLAGAGRLSENDPVYAFNSSGRWLELCFSRDASSPQSRGAEGAKLLDEIAADMAAQFNEIRPSSARKICDALRGQSRRGTTSSSSGREPSENVPARDVPAGQDELLACRVRISKKEFCPVTRARLTGRSSFAPAMKEHVRADLLAKAQKDSGSGRELEMFSDWLRNREGNPFTVILDGANIGNVGKLVSGLEAAGENPLFILTKKHHSMHGFDRLHIPSEYIVPDGKLDDLFCMFATVADQKNMSRSAVLISGDHFRDHGQRIRSSSLFCRWYEYHCLDNSSQSIRSQLIRTIRMFRRRIEGNTWPSRNGRNHYCNHEGMVWHFPVSTWGFRERFVVRLPVQSVGTD
ncbi:hypothetical protein ACHAWF_011666 [Thalassiosira exigua]